LGPGEAGERDVFGGDRAQLHGTGLDEPDDLDQPVDERRGDVQRVGHVAGSAGHGAVEAVLPAAHAVRAAGGDVSGFGEIPGCVGNGPPVLIVWFGFKIWRPDFLVRRRGLTWQPVHGRGLISVSLPAPSNMRMPTGPLESPTTNLDLKV